MKNKVCTITVRMRKEQREFLYKKCNMMSQKFRENIGCSDIIRALIQRQMDYEEELARVWHATI